MCQCPIAADTNGCTVFYTAKLGYGSSYIKQPYVGQCASKNLKNISAIAATCLSWGGNFDGDFLTNLLLRLMREILWKSVDITNKSIVAVFLIPWSAVAFLRHPFTFTHRKGRCRDGATGWATNCDEKVTGLTPRRAHRHMRNSGQVVYTIVPT